MGYVLGRNVTARSRQLNASSQPLPAVVQDGQKRFKKVSKLAFLQNLMLSTGSCLDQGNYTQVIHRLFLALIYRSHYLVSSRQKTPYLGFWRT